jgi:chromate transporter
VTEAQFFQGFALVQALPGPLFNFSSFLGAVAQGFVGAVVCWVGLFGPGILLIFAFLPFWMKVRMCVCA